MTTATTEETRVNVYKLLDDFSTAMVVTTSPGGLKSRPFHIARTDEEEGAVWFLTGKGASLIEEVESDPSVLLVFQDGHSAFLSIRGEGRVIVDTALVKQLWKEPYKVWFPGGPEDPEIALLAVQLIGAEYWDSRGSNKLEYFFEAAKAYVKGVKPHISEPGQHAKTDL